MTESQRCVGDAALRAATDSCDRKVVFAAYMCVCVKKESARLRRLLIAIGDLPTRCRHSLFPSTEFTLRVREGLLVPKELFLTFSADGWSYAGTVQSSAQRTMKRGCHVEKWVFRCYPGLARLLSNLLSSPSTSES
uniref:Uncharacterized protein n=1 Tax=Knipowitschia caucasica TaxID=637954 RepID=A0AAV2LMK4_KNICA